DLPFSLGGPVSLMVEPSAACNLRCPLCPTGIHATKRDGYTLSPDDFERALGWFRYTLQTVTFWVWGEPFLNRNLPKMVAVASRYHIASQVSTNGHFLEGPMLDELFAAGLTLLKISIDTPNAGLYTRYRVGGDFETVVRGVKHAVARKRALGARTIIEAQYMAMRGSEDMAAMIAHGRELGADQVRVKMLGIGSSVPEPTEKEWSLMPEAEALNRYADHTDVRPKIQWDDERCTYIWRRMVLNADGKCLPCSHDQLVKFELGTIKSGRSLASVWNGPAYRRYRRGIRQTQKNEIMCQRCPELVRKDLDPGVVFAARADEA
ncbi:MAG: radical SAM protein, partial [Acidobacteria bacterium]|nr:radical SAM protein [Acidobacteriota bacterium]